MKYLLFLFICLPNLSYAHCPYELSIHGTDYCLDITWDYGERKDRGQFKLTKVPSPYLIPMGEIPKKWIYSQAIITTWKKGDSNQVPVEVPGFRIFPYMHMKSGHHHSSGYEFYFSSTGQFIFRKTAFQQMPGCWSLRWTTDSKDLKESSHLLLNITNFANLTDQQVKKQIIFCENN